MNAAATVQVAAIVPAALAEELRGLAQKAERSQAAEVRLALRAWVDAARQKEAA